MPDDGGLAEGIDVYEMAISALGVQQISCCKKCNDLYDEDGGDIYPPQKERNAPLTLDELRLMSGEPVWVKHHHGGEWITVHWNIYDHIATAYKAELIASEYGERWLAYRRKPEEGTV